jgi:hypothetical protein
LKKLKGAVTVSLPCSFLTPPSAENDALLKAVAAKENTDMMIPWPPSRSSIAGNRFNLHTVMYLQNDTNLYTVLHKS